MADMFGSPVGLDIASRANREDLTASAHAIKILGEIEQQPAERALKAAHAKLYESMAAEHEAKARDAAALSALAQDARRQGVNITAEEAQNAMRPRESLAEPFVRMLDLANQRGISPTITAPIAMRAAQIQHQEASTLSAQEEAQVRQLDASRKAADRQGALAMMGLNGPEAYDQMRMQAAAEGLPIDNLPQTWGGPAVRALRNIVDSSMSVKDSIDQKRKDLHEKAQEARWKAENGLTAANVQVAHARYNLINQRYQNLKKNNGEGDPAVADLRRERTIASEEKRAALQRKEFPPVPLAPDDRKFDQSYTAADGKTRFRWVKDPTTGKGKAMLLQGMNIKPRGAASASDDDED